MGIRIPRLCYLKDISAVGSCRVCVVEIEGQDGLAASCGTVVREGMKITTDSEKIHQYRKMMLGLLADNHGFQSADYCFSCNKNGSCELQALCREYGVEITESRNQAPLEPIVKGNPFIEYNPNLCIRCQRCVGACNVQACNHTLKAAKRGTRTIIDAPFGPDWKSTDCENCGNCAAA